MINNIILNIEGILNNTDISSNAKLLYATLELKAIKLNTTKIEMPIDEAMNITGCKNTATIRAFKELEDKGYIKKIRRGQGKCNIYELI